MRTTVEFIYSKHNLQRELNLARIDSCAIDHAVVRVSQCSAGRIPDRVIRQVEDLGSKFHVLRFAHRKFLIDRGVEVENARADHGISSRVAVAELRSERKPINKCVDVEEAGAALLASSKIRVGARRIRITSSTAILDISRAAENGKWKAVLHGQDAAQLPSTQQRVGSKR